MPIYNDNVINYLSCNIFNLLLKLSVDFYVRFIIYCLKIELIRTCISFVFYSINNMESMICITFSYVQYAYGVVRLSIYEVTN